MRIKSIALTDKGKMLSIAWYSGEEDNCLNTISGTEKPLPTFKEAWDALAAAMWDVLSFPMPPDYSSGRYQRPKRTMRLQKMVFIKTDTEKGHFEKVRMELALCPWASMTDLMIMRVPPIYIKNTYTDDNPEECYSAGEASPALYKLIEAVRLKWNATLAGNGCNRLSRGWKKKRNLQTWKPGKWIYWQKPRRQIRQQMKRMLKSRIRL